MALPPVLAEKLGPLPIVGWAALGGGMVGLMLLMKGRGGSSKSSGGYTTGSYQDSASYGVPGNEPDDPRPIIGPSRGSPSLDRPKVVPISYIGQTGGQLADSGVMPLTTPNPGGGTASHSPTNVLAGFLDPITGILSGRPGPGLIAMWR